MRIIGIDPSMTGTGLCAWDGTTSTVRTLAKQRDNRLRVIGHAVAKVALAPDPLAPPVTVETFSSPYPTLRSPLVPVDLAVIEEPIQSRQSPVGLWMASAAVRMALMDAGVPYVLVHNTRVKGYATGKGNAKKPDMAAAALEHWGLTFADDNQTDAFWLRQMALDHYGVADLAMPAEQRAWLDKVDWPQIGERS